MMKFDDTETEEYKFHQTKSPISINDIDIKKQQYLISFLLLIYFIGQKDLEKIRRPCIFRPQMIIY